MVGVPGFPARLALELVGARHGAVQDLGVDGVAVQAVERGAGLVGRSTVDW